MNHDHHIVALLPIVLNSLNYWSRLQAHLHYRTPGPHLCHHAASAPHINRRAIVPLTKQQLWRAIPGVQKFEVTYKGSILTRV